WTRACQSDDARPAAKFRRSCPCQRPTQPLCRSRNQYWEVESEFGILLQKIRDLQAGEIRYHKVGLGRADLEQESREIGVIVRHELIGRKLPAVGLHEALGNPQ